MAKVLYLAVEKLRQYRLIASLISEVLLRLVYEFATANNMLERTSVYRGRAVLGVDCVLAGAEWAPCQAAQQVR